MRGDKMKKLFFGTLLLALVIAVSIPTMVRADVNVRIALPPPIVFAAPPALIVLPETYVYVVPDVEAEIFFYNGWWWRLWEGRWYRSRYYNSGWGYYRSIPSFYAGIPSGWRNDYRDHRWRGHQWNYQRIPHQQVQQNWRGWEKDRHWEKQQTWGVQGLKPRVQSQQQPHAVQPLPKSQVKPQSRQQLKEVKPERLQQRREASPQSQEVVKPQQSQTKTQVVKPQTRKAPKPQQSEPRQEKPERGDEGKRDRK